MTTRLQVSMVADMVGRGKGVILDNEMVYVPIRDPDETMLNFKQRAISIINETFSRAYNHEQYVFKHTSSENYKGTKVGDYWATNIMTLKFNPHAK